MVMGDWMGIPELLPLSVDLSKPSTESSLLRYFFKLLLRLYGFSSAKAAGHKI